MPAPTEQASKLSTSSVHRITSEVVNGDEVTISIESDLSKPELRGYLDGEHPIDLLGFGSLRDISWTGLQSDEDFDTLGSALKNNALHLEQLQLDFVNWTPDYWDEDSSFFAGEILKLPAAKFAVMFPALLWSFLLKIASQPTFRSG
jgi:hypothetical protein